MQDTAIAAIRTHAGVEVPTQGTWELDPTHTTITFEVRHMMISKIRGSFGAANGTILVTGDPLESVVDISVDAASVETGTEDRDAHLRSPDFFDVEAFPLMSFKSTSVEPAGDAYTMKGELTIKDVTRSISFEFGFTGGIVDPYGNSRAAFTASFEVDREDWELTWNMPLETGGVLVGKKIRVSIDTEATRIA